MSALWNEVPPLPDRLVKKRRHVAALQISRASRRPTGPWLRLEAHQYDMQT